MAQLKLTKTELRIQQIKLAQLQKYLPTLQLKKAMLQVEVNSCQQEIESLLSQFHQQENHIARFSSLFTDKYINDFFSSLHVSDVKKTYENIAGVDIPIFQSVTFAPATYMLFDTPIWYETAIDSVKKLITLREKEKVAQDKKIALEKELREVSIRVNLFEKIMIPRAQDNIKKIKIFLGDLQLAAVSQAKVAKKKIEMRNQKSEAQGRS
ncbi:MAG: V-type ATP synthase subunit D [Chlamydiae bacterium]|nr:V-type ATP synthase subunit D [Chlamydiota bacterium]